MAMRAKRRVFVPLTLVVAMCATAAAVVTATASGSGSAAGTIVYRVNSTWATLDPHRFHGAAVSGPSMPAYDRLVARGPGLKVVPYLASSWKATPKAIVFQLRKDATCSDGTRITPDVVAQSLRRAIDVPKLASNIPTFLGPGPFAFSADAKKWTVTARSGTPYRNFLGGFAHPLASIVCPAGLTASAGNVNALAERMFGSGPYTLVSNVIGDQLVFKLRPEWKWGPGGAAAKDLVETLIYKVVGNVTTAANLLITGGLDLANITGPDVDRLAADRSFIHKVAKGYNVHPLIFNQYPGHITTDEKVREALMTAVDPKAWNIAANVGRGTVSSSLFVPGAECYDKKTAELVPKPSVDRARQILLADGWTLSGGKLVKGGQTLKLTLLTGRQLMSGGGEYIAKQWRDVGVEVELLDADSSIYTSRYVTGNADAIVSYIQVSVPDPGQRLAQYAGPIPPSGGNFFNTGGGDVTLQRWARLAFSTLGAESCSWFSKVQQRLIQKHYLLPLAAPSVDFFSRGVEFIAALDNLEPAYFRKK